MNVNIRNRFLIFGAVFALLFAVLFVQLIKLTLVQGAKYAADMEELSPRTVTESGARGSILDRNGLPLAYDVKSYNVQFYKDPLKSSATDRAYYTGIITDAIRIVEQNGGKAIDTFAIKYDDKTGQYYFDFGITNKDAITKREKNWRGNMYIGSDKADWNPEQIYVYLRDRYQIPSEMGYEDARKILSIWQEVQLGTWVAYEPVTIAYNVNIQTVAEIETHTAELSGMSISEGTTRIYPRGSLAAHIIGYISPITADTLENYGVPDISDKYIANAKKILETPFYAPIVKQEYGDVSIPDNAADTIKSPGSLTDFGFTDSQLRNLKDVNISDEDIAAIRKLMASSFFGPLIKKKYGDVSIPNQIRGLQDLGYSVEDLIGAAGIEKTMEAYLTGNTTERQGKQEVEVDNMAVVKNILSSTAPKQGNNVMLTIDVPLQQAVEDSLAKNIPYIRSLQLKHYEDYKTTKAYRDLDINKVRLANSGAAVVIDINTGKILAMASNPTFDPNLFIQGMTQDEFAALGYGDKELAPLLDRAVSSRGTPGSIFKMVAGLGALMGGMNGDLTKGTSLTEEIDDKYSYDKYTLNKNEQSPHCWQRNSSKHQDQTIVQGLMNSCNYYFFTMADRIGIDKLNEWGDKFGLTASTGIELPAEAIGQVGGQDILFDGSKSVYNQATAMPRLVKESQPYGIESILNKYAKDVNIQYNPAEIDATADELVNLMEIEWKADPNDPRKVLKDPDGVSMGEHVREVLQKNLRISRQRAIARHLDTEISSMLSQLIWSPVDTIETAIGQRYVQVTPVAVARYVAAIVNGGTVYQAHIVDKVVDQNGQVVFEQKPEVFGTLGAPQVFLDKIMQGMGDVVNDGTASIYFEKFKYKDSIGGKTGTAEVSQIDLENNSWFVCFAPYKEDDPSIKPEIAVVAYVPQGYTGGYSSYIAQDIVEFYLDREAQSSQQTIPDPGSLVGN